MKSKINQILSEIEQKTKELKIEYSKLLEKYDFSLIKGKIVFSRAKKEKDKKSKNSILSSVCGVTFKEFLSIPFIYLMIIPVFFLDVFLFIYQNTALRLYGIPLVKRCDYITFDRKELAYLNFIQKFNCLYCAYVNGFFSYAVEIGGRTEKYWCPIKYAKKMKGGHDWQKYFADYGDPDGFKEIFHSKKEYSKKV